MIARNPYLTLLVLCRKNSAIQPCYALHHISARLSNVLEILIVGAIKPTPSLTRICSVDSQGDVSNHSVSDVTTIKWLHLNSRIPASNCLAAKDAIHIIRRASNLSMSGVRLHGHNLLGCFFVKKELSGGGNVASCDRAVVADSPVGVRSQVDVDCSLDVEAGENSRHFHNAVAVSWPHTAQPCSVSGVQITRQGRVKLGKKVLEAGVGRKLLKRGVASRRIA